MVYSVFFVSRRKPQPMIALGKLGNIGKHGKQSLKVRYGVARWGLGNGVGMPTQGALAALTTLGFALTPRWGVSCRCVRNDSSTPLAKSDH
jgi:hypothetical protein